MKAFALKRVEPPPPPPEPKLCVVCKGFRAECVVPVGEGSAPMCWLCAHHVVDHACEPHEACTAECECLPHEIYPGREAPTVYAMISERFVHQVEGAGESVGATSDQVGVTLKREARRLLESMSRAQRRAFLNGGAPRSQAQYQRAGAAATKGLKATLVSVDEPKQHPSCNSDCRGPGCTGGCRT